jgi:hypothetical protein
VKHLWQLVVLIALMALVISIHGTEVTAQKANESPTPSPIPLQESLGLSPYWHIQGNTIVDQDGSKIPLLVYSYIFNGGTPRSEHRLYSWGEANLDWGVWDTISVEPGTMTIIIEPRYIPWPFEVKLEADVVNRPDTTGLVNASFVDEATLNRTSIQLIQDGRPQHQREFGLIFRPDYNQPGWLEITFDNSSTMVAVLELYLRVSKP